MTEASPDDRRRWLERIDAGPTDWPEWSALRALAAEAPLRRETAPHVYSEHLVGRDPHGTFSVTLDDGRGGPSPPPPSMAFAALRDLKRDDDLLAAGGIASLPDDAVVDAASEGQYFAWQDPSSVAFPGEPLRLLQSDPGGTWLFWTPGGTVYGFAPGASAFEPVGALDDLLRFCLAQFLDGRPWHRAYEQDDLGPWRLRRVPLH